ncbi:MAG: helix-turn-helix domain-containing protein [Planctomycetota bacterium]
MGREIEKFVDIQAAADFLGVSAKTVRRYCTSLVRERLPHYRFMGKLRFRLSEASEWAERTRNRPQRCRGRHLAVANVGVMGYTSNDSETGAASNAGEEVR